MKLAFMPFLLVSVLNLRKELINSAYIKFLLFVASPCFVISFVTPFFTNDSISYFYYTSDAVGLAVALISIFVFLELFKNGSLDVINIERIFSVFLTIVSIYIIIYYFFSGGDKISITPEMYIPMAVVIGAYLCPVKGGSAPPFLLIALVAFACALSQLRENLVIYAAVGVICILRGLVLAPRNGRNAMLFLVATLIVGVFTPGSQTLVAERLSSMTMKVGPLFPGVMDGVPTFAEGWLQSLGKAVGVESTEEEKSGPIFTDGSINQRIVEVQLMYDEMALSPWTFLLGKGFGATYENKEKVLIYYGERVHNAHSTPFVVFFRNGLYGIILYLVPAVLAVFTLFSRNVLVFRASLTVLIMYAAFMINQYFYWNVNFGLAVAFLIFSLRERHTSKLALQ